MRSKPLSWFLGQPGLSLFAEPPHGATDVSFLRDGPRITGLVLDEHEHFSECFLASCRRHLPTVRLLSASGSCECSYDILQREEDNMLVASAPSTHGPGRGGSRPLVLSPDRTLLRLRAPESATPGVNWALGLDALRILEYGNSDVIDWLVSVDAEDEADMRERIEVCS